MLRCEKLQSSSIMVGCLVLLHPISKQIQILTHSPTHSGSFFCKAGWSSDEYPRLIFPSVAAKSRTTTASTATLPESFAGNDLHLVEPTDRTQIKSPFENGLILSFQTQVREESVFLFLFDVCESDNIKKNKKNKKTRNTFSITYFRDLA